jgi:chaperonin GroEL
VTKDGVTVANEIELEQKVENLGVNMIREVASRTNDDTGDGTTTATVLAQSMYSEGLKLIEAGVNPMDLKRGMDSACVAMVKHLKKHSQKVDGDADVRHIAMVSANGDESIGGVVADAMKRVTKDDTVTIELNQGIEDDVEIVEGMQFDRGYISPYFITNQDDMTVELEAPYVLVC